MIDITLDTPRGRMAGLRWGRRGGRPLLALHGWLDNAASFIALADAMAGVGEPSVLDDIDLVAIDLPGHGYSAHRAPGAWYHMFDYVDDVDAVLDGLGWSRCDLLGHSLGGAIATEFAVAAAERVDRLLLIEALGPLSWRPGSAAASLAGARRDRRALTGKNLRVFRDPAQAIAARMQVNQLSEPAARSLVNRGLAPVEGGFVWRSDPRLTLTTPIRISEAQIEEWVSAIEQPTLLIGSDPPSPILDAELRQSRVELLRNATQKLLPGGHHLHMEQPVAVAAAILAFLQSTA